MRQQLLLFFIACIPLAGQSPVSQVALSENQGPVSLMSGTGKRLAAAVHLQVDLSYPRGPRERRDLSVVFDQQSGRYMWELASFPAPTKGKFREDLESRKAALYSGPEGLVQFWYNTELFVKVRSGLANSLDDAKRLSLEELANGLTKIEPGYKVPTTELPSWPWDFKPLDVFHAIGSEMFCASDVAYCTGKPSTIELIEKQGGNWRVIVRNRFDVEVILDQSFKLLSARKLTQP
jgi:hypothetical protein